MVDLEGLLEKAEVGKFKKSVMVQASWAWIDNLETLIYEIEDFKDSASTREPFDRALIDILIEKFKKLKYSIKKVG